MKPYDKDWSTRIKRWRSKLLQQVAHLPLLPGDSEAELLPAVELAEITVCGEMNMKEEDCANPKKRKPVVFQKWREVDREDGGGQQIDETECGKFVRMTVYVFGRVFGSATKQNDTTQVVYATAACEDGTPYPPTTASFRKFNVENIAQYKVLERYAR